MPSTVPQITIEYMTKSEVTQAGLDSLELRISYTDGDGDLGVESGTNLWVYDGRNDSVVARLTIPPYSQQVGKLQKGQLDIRLRSACCVYPDGSRCGVNIDYPRDTLRYLVRVRDAAGQWSNTATSDFLVLDCLK